MGDVGGSVSGSSVGGAASSSSVSGAVSQSSVAGSVSQSSVSGSVSQSSVGGAVAAVMNMDHGNLLGLADDDHTQYLLVDGTRAMTGALDMGTAKIENVVDPTSDQEAATKKYVDDNAGVSLWEIDGSETQLKSADDIDMQTKKIINLVDPAIDQDAATKKYVDDNSGGTPGGVNTNVQFNDSGSFGGSPTFKWDGSTLTITGDIYMSGEMTAQRWHSRPNTAFDMVSHVLDSAIQDAFVIRTATTVSSADIMSIRNNTSEKIRVQANGNTTVNGGLTVASSSYPFQPPRVTTVQKNAMNPNSGGMVFDVTLAKLCVYNGAAWETVTSV